MSMEFDIGIIGGGPAGYTTALYASSQGKSVVLFEKDKLGGTCLNRGCIPTKAFMHIADLYSEIQNSEKLGISFDNLNLDFSKVVDYKNGIINKLQKSLELMMKNSKITVINSEAQIVEKTKIKSGDEEYICKDIILATGSKPREVKGLEFDGEFVLSSDDILNMSELPKSIAIIGSGAIGTEWARIFSAFGVEVTVIELADRLVPLSDWEVSKRVERIFKTKKIKFYTSTSVNNIENKVLKLSNGEELSPEKVLVAIGRTPVKTQTEFSPKIIGDASGEIQLAHYAVSQAKELVLGISYDKDLIPSVIYGTPEIAWIGKTSKSREEDNEYDKVMLPISALGKAHCDNSIEGFIKILSKDGKIVGASIVSKEASSLIQQLTIAMQNEITVNEMKKICFPHPTYSEGILESLMRL